MFRSPPTDEEVQELEEKWYEQITTKMEFKLGAEHDVVMHAIIPFDVGGALDLYYFPNGIEGTAIATKELSHAHAESPANDVFEKYELVMFTRHKLDLDLAHDENSAFGKAHQNIARILNPIAHFSQQATLNPFETCEFPEEMEDVGGKTLIFDAYGEETATKRSFGLLAVIEVFRSEMEFARKNNSQKLLHILKERGHYPYSDLDREPVV